MLIFIVCSILMVAMLDRALRVERIRLLELTTANDLRSLQDRLYRSKKTLPRHPDALFNFCNTILSLSIEFVPRLNIYGLLGTNAIADRSVVVILRDIRAQLQESQNIGLKQIMDEHDHCINRFLQERHRIVFPLVMRWYSSRRPGLDLNQKLAAKEFTIAVRTSRNPIEAELRDEDCMLTHA